MAWVSISLFAGFLKKENSWKLWFWFSKMFHQGVFLTEYEEFRNFRFDGKFSIFTDSRSVKMHIEFRVSDNNRPFAIDGFMINFL